MTGRSSRAAWVIGTLLSALWLSGCGDKSPEADKTAEPQTSAANETPSPTPTDSPLPTEEPTPVVPEFGPGDVVLSVDDLTLLCSEATGGLVTAEQDGSSGSVARILPSGVVLLDCDSEGSTTLAAVDARANALLWARPLLVGGDPTYELLLEGGTTNLYVASATLHPAEGLNDETYSRDVTALDAKTGTELWTQPIDPEVTDNDYIEGTVHETPAVDGSTLAVVNIDDYSAFDGATGTPLWRVPDLDPRGKQDNVTYVGYGRTMGITWTNDEDAALTGTDLGTGKLAWSVPIDLDQTVFGDADHEWADGTEYWVFNDEGFDAYDVLTGDSKAHGLFPTSFENTLASPSYTVALVDKSLRVYRTGDWSSVLWSVPADSASPVVATDKAVVVYAQAGTILLDMADGQVLDEDFPYEPTQSEVIGGLYANDDGEIIEMGEL